MRHGDEFELIYRYNGLRLYDFQILFQTKKYQKVMMVCSDDWSKFSVRNIKNELVSRYEHVENQLIVLN
ncbi:hypothetical protein BpHYR1_008948 [Brachionus plicatilis]|uniref:Uncharacterized protein n=1 Tax=Brachionus plicatilis TaxID=10195 RepID=A0A3M7SCG3_BRAPC|nr:hypothetical protein BpHYR1_008948 [Brachionus plicatilis]